MVRFGPSGNSDSFYEQGHKSSVEMPAWLRDMGLSAYEYQCNRGVRISEEMARQLGEQARKSDIFLSIHAPYYINLASVKEDFDAALDKIGNALGQNRLKSLHSHFSRIEFTKGGEKKHWTIDDIQYGPEFELLAECLVERGMEPVIICESRDNMAEDALKLRNIYNKVAGRKTK